MPKMQSPGFYSRENLTQTPNISLEASSVGLIGPTLKGPAMVPTDVSSYSEFQRKFGDLVESGSRMYQYFTSHAAKSYFDKGGERLTVVRILAGDYSAAQSDIPVSGSTFGEAENEEASASFTLETLSHGDILNNSGSYKTNNILESGSVDNVQWEVGDVDETRGTFSLYIRRGDDNIKRKIILESWNNLSLDPTSNNFIAKRIGDQRYTLLDAGTDQPFLQETGSYENNSDYVRVIVNKTTPRYLDENGDVRNSSFTGSLPAVNTSGSFSGGSDGNVEHPINFYENITNTNSQGYKLSEDDSGSVAYNDALNLLSNRMEYNIDILALPGIIAQFTDHASVVSKAIDVCEQRKDCIYIPDLVPYGSSISDVVSKASEYDTSYASTYWPWIKTPDTEIGKDVWVVPSTIIPAVYRFTDEVAEPYYAPAGFNRASMDTVVRAERKLSRNNLGELYSNGVNPLATFTGDGVIVWGQKTLTKKPSPVDRVNVRRLLIDAKKFIRNISKYIVFEQNVTTTRKNFKNKVNPYFERIKQDKGLYDFKVIMNDQNNTDAIIEQNILYGQIALRPTYTSEYILIDFDVQSGTATFSDE